MQFVEAVADAEVRDACGSPVYRLARGTDYALYAEEAAAAECGGAVRRVDVLERVVPRYDGAALTRERLLVPFIGRLGDAVVLTACLQALRERYPRITIDVAAPSLAQAVLKLADPGPSLVSYPPTGKALRGYDFFLSFCEVEAERDAARRSLADVFSACLRTPRPSRPAVLRVPDAALGRWSARLAGRRVVALHAGVAGSLRSLSGAWVDEAVRLLVAGGFTPCLVGAKRDSSSGSAARKMMDLRGETPSPADLAAVLGCCEALITCDSFPLHLAGALGVSVVAVFTSTSAAIAADYPNVIALASSAACSPCTRADGACPLGFARCVALDDARVSPEAAVVECVGVRVSRRR